MHKGLLALPTLLLLSWAATTSPAVDDKGAAPGSNWPRFRGPNGTGVSADKDVPVEFSDTKNVLWKTPLPGAGHSSPVVWGDRVFLESAPADGKARQLVCLSASKGNVLWSKSVSGDKAKTHAKSSLASSTPSTDGERVYASFWDGSNVFVYAYDFAGKELWKRDLGAFKSQHGAGGSPVVYEGRVFFNFDQDGAAAIVALDAKNGQVIWKKDRPAFRTCYSTPFVRETAGGGAELIVGSTAGITSYKPDTGAENWKWSWDFQGIMPQRTVGSPIAGNGLIFQTSGDGSGSRYMVALEPGEKARIVWENKKSFPYVPTMLERGDHLYFVNDGGVAACHEAKTGTEVWKERLGGGFSASPVLIDGKVYAPSEDGYVHVFAAEPQYKLLAKNKFGEGERFVASPAVAGGRLYLRGKDALYCVGKKGQ